MGADYRAAGRARSKAEFIARLGVVEERRTRVPHWMEVIIEGDLMKANLVDALLEEANELVAIMTSSRITTYRRQFSGEQGSSSRVRKSKITNQKSKIL